MNSLFKILSLFIAFIILSCDVNFDDNYRTYIDNIAERNPLDFEISGGTTIDNKDAINMGYLITDRTTTYTIVNNEKVDIHLKKFPGVNGDFSIGVLEAQTVKAGGSFTFDVTFNATSDNWEKTVSKEVAFYDTEDRPFRFDIWATSDKQPLEFYDLEDNIITKLDLEAWETDKDFTIKVVNEGLSRVEVTNTSVPGGVDYKSSYTFGLDIHESYEITLCYDFYSYIVINGAFLNLTTDFPYDNSLELELYGGGGLPVTVKNSGNTDIGNSYNFSTPATNPISETFSISNTGSYKLNLELMFDNIPNADLYNYSPTVIDLDSLTSSNFTVSFRPEAVGNFNVNFYIRDKNTNRSHTVTFYGTGT